MKQGFHSKIFQNGNRLHKIINCHDFLGPFEECAILKRVSALGPEFPQNVECEGVYKLSYDYIDGITLQEYVENVELYHNQLDIFSQLLSINMKLIKNGIELCDQVLENFIIDYNGMIHAIDFGNIIIHDDGFEYYTCLTQAVYRWYKNGLISEELVDLYNNAEDVMILIEQL
jgi:RIO-like serine/threonine protein kinase